MLIILNVISNNYTSIKKHIIHYNDNSIVLFINFLYELKLIPSTDFLVFYKNEKIDLLPNLEKINLIIRENKNYKCSCIC